MRTYSEMGSKTVKTSLGKVGRAAAAAMVRVVAVGTGQLVRSGMEGD